MFCCSDIGYIGEIYIVHTKHDSIRNNIPKKTAIPTKIFVLYSILINIKNSFFILILFIQFYDLHKFPYMLGIEEKYFHFDLVFLQKI